MRIHDFFPLFCMLEILYNNMEKIWEPRWFGLSRQILRTTRKERPSEVNRYQLGCEYRRVGFLSEFLLEISQLGLDLGLGQNLT